VIRGVPGSSLSRAFTTQQYKYGNLMASAWRFFATIVTLHIVATICQAQYATVSASWTD
jgi:hypothetical protein